MIIGITLYGYMSHLPEKKMQAIILFAVLVIQYVAEHISPADKKYNNAKNEGRNFIIGILNSLLLFIPSALLIELLSIIEKYKIGLLQQFQIPLWLHILVTIVIMDFAMYWWHRINHTQKIFWKFHRFHHKDEMMNTTTALRFHVIELLFSSFFKALFFIVMGFSFAPVIIYEILFFIIVIIHHSNIRISKRFDLLYRKLFSSPLMHRIHHSNIKEETDTNYGSVFSFWDRICNTYKKQARGAITFGVSDSDK